MRPQLAHLDRITVRRGAHGPGGPDRAARADDVLDDDPLTERTRHVLADEARGDIGRAARRKRHDHGDRPRRINLPRRVPDKSEPHGGYNGQK
jgi:hypothetical protein